MPVSTSCQMEASETEMETLGAACDVEEFRASGAQGLGVRSSGFGG